MLLILFVMMFGVPLLSLLRRFEIFSYYCDDATRSTWVWLKKTKFETRLFFLISFYKMICTQFHTNIKVIRTNNAQEYFLKYFFYCSWYYSLALLFYNSTTKLSCREKTPTYILSMARALKFQSNVPLYPWGDCVLTVLHIINRLPSPILQNKSPFKKLYSKLPSYDQK